MTISTKTAATLALAMLATPSLAYSFLGAPEIEAASATYRSAAPESWYG